MALKRTPFQGIYNVLRFNWHFYVIAAFSILILLLSARYFGDGWKWLPLAASGLMALNTLISMAATYYIYDLSDLYDLKWLDDINPGNKRILNINAGFDETSSLLEEKFADSELSVCDFYDPEYHTEISIQRARKAYPPHPGTVRVNTSALPYPNETFDMVCIIFAAHEIRNTEERIRFFEELARVTNANGKIYVTEHIRDTYNFMAYTIGFLHFYSLRTWKHVFKSARLNVLDERRTTVFVRTFILTPNGNNTTS